MRYRIIAGILFVISLGAILFGYLLLHPWLIGLCSKNSYCLDDSLDFGVGSPLYWGTYLLPILFFILIFVRREVFSAWWKVILPFTILAFIVIIASPPLPDFLTPDRTAMTELMVKLIFIISGIVIIWKYWRLSRKPRNAGVKKS